MDEDISNKTIVVLVVLTVIISVLSTLVVLNEVSGLKTTNTLQVQKTSTTSGQIQLEIKDDPVSTTGLIIFKINDN